MVINGVKLKGFSKEEPFGFIDICAERFAGVYIIIKKDIASKSEIVKIGESKSVFSRFANYLSPFRTDKEEKSSNRKTKRCFRQKVQKGILSGSKYFFILKPIENQKERKSEERRLIENFIEKNNRPPAMNNESWIVSFLSKLNSQK